MYRNPASILDPTAVDTGKGSTNGTVNSVNSTLPRGYEPRLRYNHMGILSHLPNGSIAAAWQVRAGGCRSAHTACMIPLVSPLLGAPRHVKATCTAAGWRDRLEVFCGAQATPKWFEGPSDQGIWWAVSDDYGLTWGPTRQIIPAVDSLPQWGPVLHSQVPATPVNSHTPAAQRLPSTAKESPLELSCLTHAEGHFTSS